VEDPPVSGDAAVRLPTPGEASRTTDTSWTVNPSVYDGSWPQFLARCSVGGTITCPGCSKDYPAESSLWSHIASGKHKCQGPPRLVLEQWVLWYDRTFPSRQGKKREREAPESLAVGSRWVAGKHDDTWYREAGFFDDENDYDSWHHIAWWDSESDPGEHLVDYYVQNPCVEFPVGSRIRQQARQSGRVSIGARQRTH
jgi:hypothetical protein